MSNLPVTHCRSCGAEIIWAHTEDGNRMPLDAKPSRRAVVRQRPEELVEMRIVNTYQSHFATCPSASAHRRSSGG